MLKTLIGAVALGCGLALSAAAQPVERDWNGVRLVALPAEGRAFDVPIAESDEAIARMGAALDALLRASATAREALGALKAAGPVFIIYAPGFPAEYSSSLGTRIAAFAPDATPGVEGVSFPVIVGRYGVRWPERELAAILAHELLGHGGQHRRGALGRLTRRDAECEAALYQEIAHQDLQLNKSTEIMIAFRRQMEQDYCAGFRQFLFQTDRAALALWERRDPDARALLQHFEVYTAAIY